MKNPHLRDFFEIMLHQLQIVLIEKRKKFKEGVFAIQSFCHGIRTSPIMCSLYDKTISNTIRYLLGNFIWNLC